MTSQTNMFVDVLRYDSQNARDYCASRSTVAASVSLPLINN
jgi:hypothetical protein